MILVKVVLFFVQVHENQPLNFGIFETWNIIKLSVAPSTATDCSKEVLTNLCSPVLDYSINVPSVYRVVGWWDTVMGLI